MCVSRVGTEGEGTFNTLPGSLKEFATDAAIYHEPHSAVKSDNPLSDLGIWLLIDTLLGNSGVEKPGMDTKECHLWCVLKAIF